MFQLRKYYPAVAFFFLTTTLLGWVLPGMAQTQALHSAAQVETVTTLQSILGSIQQIDRQIKQFREELTTPEGTARQEELLKSIAAALVEKEALEQRFERIGTGVDSVNYEDRLQIELDWAKELRELLSPIIVELKAFTDRPRELERLRREAAYYQERILDSEKALTRLDQLTQDLTPLEQLHQGPAIIEKLTILKKEWLEKQQQAQSGLAAAKHQLSELLAERKNFFESAQKMFAGFFRSRGRNLAMAMMAFALTFLFMRFLHRTIERVSPWHREKRRSFFIRLIDVVYYALTFLFSVLAALTTIYLYGDWAILGLALIFLMGLAWAARHGLPIFWLQSQLLLNLGTVREGEVVIMGGLPWHVETINVFTYLSNPLLKGGRKRLPLRDLLGLRSRAPREGGETWFPCREGDWVILADGVRGKVVAQTPEIVELIILGGSHVHYTTGDFLGASPKNISQGFRLRIPFGIDYVHQSIATTEAPQLMHRAIDMGLKQKDQSKYLKSLKVEFKTAGASSLDLEILADFDGQAAPQYETLDRLINRLAVDACNQYGWIIPFTQITLHQA